MASFVNTRRKLFIHAAHRTVGVSAAGISLPQIDLGGAQFDGCGHDRLDEPPLQSDDTDAEGSDQ